MDDDAVGKVVASLFLIIGIFLIPLIIISVNSDITERSYVDENVQEFCEMVRSTGCLSKANYEEMRNALSATGNIYKITFLHRSYRAIPDGDGEYRSAFTAYGTTEILNYIYGTFDPGDPCPIYNSYDPLDEKTWDYTMKDGDYFSITVEGVNPTKGASFLKLLTGGRGNEHLYCTSGGMIGNTKR